MLTLQHHFGKHLCSILLEVEMHAGYAFSKLADRLSSVVEVPDGDIALLAKMPSTIKHYNSHQLIIRKGNNPNQCCLVLRGYACWQDPQIPKGQIISVYVAGDIPDLGAMHGLGVDANLFSLGPTVIALVPHEFLFEISRQSPAMSSAFLKLMLIDAAVLRNRVVDLGSRDALARVAHFLCEIMARLRAVGLGKDFELPMPFTQADLASACGITAVHANRTIQALRHSGLLQWQSRTISINDWTGLVHLANFQTDYLHLRQSTAPDTHSVRPLQNA
jgi:CRP-like cAMP-binding protein